MKIPKQLIEKYKQDFHYSELKTKDWNTDSWKLDKKPYYKIKDAFIMHNKYGSFIEIPSGDMIYLLKRKENCF